MLSYCEYLAMKKANPKDDVYIENIIYDIPECNDIICQWNGYELARVFGIKAPNIKEYFTEAQWESVIADIRTSEFWLRNWNYPVHFVNAFRNEGLDIMNIRGDFEMGGNWVGYDRNRKHSFKDDFRHREWYIYMQYQKSRFQNRMLKNKVDYRPKLFVASDDNLFTGQQLWFKNVNSGIEDIESEVRSAFKFPAFADTQNQEALAMIMSCNSVAIHARRGDMLGYNYPLYRYGYFKRAVRYIKKRVPSPVFFVFCDSDSVSWARENESVIGLDFKVDNVHFVDWNTGEDSYRDMQLMAQCKHQVITNSSFGWWGAWLNQFPGKITISPNSEINTTKTI